MTGTVLTEPSTQQRPPIFWFVYAGGAFVLALVPVVVGWLASPGPPDAGHVLGAIAVLVVAGGGCLVMVLRQRASEAACARYRLCAEMLASIELPSALTDMDGRVTYCNEAIESIGGCTPDELMGEPWFQALGPDFDEALAARILRHTRRGGWKGEVHPPSGDEPRCVQVVSTVVRDERQRPAALAWVFEDITEHDRRARDLIRMARVAEHCPDAIVCTDMDGHITSWNHGAERLFGYIRENVVNRNIDILIPHDLKDSYHETMKAKMFEKGLIESIETVRLHADGTHIPVHLAVANIPDDNGEIVGRACVLHDISKRRELEEQLRQYALGLQDDLKHVERRVAAVERARRQLLPHVTSFVVVADGDAKVRETSPSVHERLGFSEKELQVMKLTDFHDRTHARYVNDMIGTARHGGTASGSVQITDRHGQKVETELELTYFPEINSYQAVYVPLET